ncbi:MAG TPA: 2,3-bisphosphoglycerate-independent phosphoglycerate mutase [Pseudomonadales bacterium]|nr:2,3-bisphosphoglycerate-independent phosphoglycerate mutase [Pseudomonadales bacterium]
MSSQTASAPNTAKKPLVLLILDGWGHSEETRYNAIAHAECPTWRHLWNDYPHSLISGSGMDVGLPKGQMGNSEVGHMNLGAGRVVYQDLTRITKAIDDGDFFENPVLVSALDKAVKTDNAVHIFGLLSDGGVHSHEEHFQAMAQMAAKRGVKKLFVHAFLDGRDTAPRSAEGYIHTMEHKFAELGVGRIASICGRYYAMDRDKRWERVVRAWKLLTQGEGEYKANSALEALSAAYARDENDEFVCPTIIIPEGGQAEFVRDGDVIIFMNFRADRARQLTRAFVEPGFDGFERGYLPKIADFVMMTEYASDIKTPVAFPPSSLSNVLGEYLSKLGKTQFRIAESEKYAHVTYFFNGGEEQPFEGEDRVVVRSPDVPTFDLKPEMSAFEVTDKLVDAITSGKYDVVICNYANGDQVGHSGVFPAAVKAVEAVDACLKRVLAAVQSVGAEMIITADHGNLEVMFDEKTGQPNTAHTTDLVPFIFVGRPVKEIKSGGVLSDVAPTMLKLMGIPKPKEMTGRELIELA